MTISTSLSATIMNHDTHVSNEPSVPLELMIAPAIVGALVWVCMLMSRVAY